MNIRVFTATIRFRILNQAFKDVIQKNEDILDVGCGNGIITKLIKDHFSVNITACDINNYLIYNLPFIDIRLNKLRKIKKRFNSAMLNDVLHHIPKNEQEKILEDCLKVADKVLIFEAEPTWSGKIADIILNKHHYNSLNIPLSFRRIAEWQKLFKKMNLKFKSIKAQKPFWYPFSHIAFCVQKG